MSNFEHKGSFPPWSRIVSLSEMTREAGIDFDEFIEAIKNDLSVEEMSRKFEISTTTIKQLREHFFHYGISSVMGGD
ncbi:MAG TPA: helix-turn-helix domain-containing protein [Syntrophomonadaceae bacterium]|nr:helix-turn-helix domain-containing protein [Syntrophomonadaceae bacterium]